MVEKIYFSYNKIHKLVKALHRQIEESGFNPDIIVAIGTGGFIPGRIIKTYLNKPLLTVGVKYYDDNNQPIDRPQKIQWIDEIEKKLKDKKILLIDEIDDTRTTLAYCLNELYQQAPEEIAVAVLHLKKKEKSADFPSQLNRYFVGEEIEDHWVYYPWDAEDIDAHEKLCKE